MPESACHVVTVPPRERAKAAIQRLGLRRVAEWCGVGGNTPYQWLSRGTDAEPIPPGYVPAIVAGARRDGFEIDPAELWPAASVLSTPRPADEDHVRPRDFLAAGDAV